MNSSYSYSYSGHFPTWILYFTVPLAAIIALVVLAIIWKTWRDF